MEPIVEPMEVEIEHAQETEVSQPTPTNSKSKPIKKSGRITRSQTLGKGNIEEILQAIDIEENLVVKVVDVKGRKKKNKGLTTKKIDFS